MTEEEIKDKIRLWVTKFPRSYFKKIKAKKNLEILKYIEDNTPLLSDPYYLISTKVYWIVNGLTDFPRCKICGNPIKKNIKATEGYPRHCSAKCLAADETVKRHKEEAFSRRYGDDVTNPFQSDIVKRQIAATMLKKYGKRSYTQTQEYRDKVNALKDTTEAKRIATMRRNDSFNESKLESIVEYLLRKKFPDLRTQYTSEEYPFRCDFFIPSTSQYVEYNGTWTHGDHPFDPSNPEDVKTLADWQCRDSKYYKNAIETWTVRDVRKREFAKEKNLNFIELWNISDVYRFVGIDMKEDLEIPFQRNRLIEEFTFYANVDPKTLPASFSRRNQIVKFFQQDVFFRTEKEMWKNSPEKREFLIRNRETHLHKPFSEMSIPELLMGFKISGLHYGYSQFNPLWFRWFISHVGCRSVYDPFGGWGHRLLGGLSLDKYIYNDLSREIRRNVDRIVEYFRIRNTETHSEDALGFVPQTEFDSIFTCPPYFNLEEYPCGKFPTRNTYDDTLRFVHELYMKTETCRSMGIVIREDLLLPEMRFSERFPLNEYSGHLSKGGKKIPECLYVFRKSN